MRVGTLAQPNQQLGEEVLNILDSQEYFSRIVLVSAFVGLRTILRLRNRLLTHVENGTRLYITAGIDLGGTSRGVLEEILQWECSAFVMHNPNVRATFHPKLYLFESENAATLFVGSNNLTDGGFYTNYEAATRYEFDLPNEGGDYVNILDPLSPFLFPQPSEIARPLSAELIQVLSDRGELPTEAEARRRSPSIRGNVVNGEIPPNPFSSISVALPPLLPDTLRVAEQQARGNGAAGEVTNADGALNPRPATDLPEGALVWRKVLPQSDALQVNPGTAHVGGVRLTQARFESPTGHRIDQTTYFRQLFADYEWEPETGRRRQTDQEHTFVPMRLILQGMDYGVRNFEISHKPSGEAGQDNYTTILRWGTVLTPIIQRSNITGLTLSLYEVVNDEVNFLIDVS